VPPTLALVTAKPLNPEVVVADADVVLAVLDGERNAACGVVAPVKVELAVNGKRPPDPTTELVNVVVALNVVGTFTVVLMRCGLK
jgi:hypothetical protein